MTDGLTLDKCALVSAREQSKLPHVVLDGHGGRHGLKTAVAAAQILRDDETLRISVIADRDQLKDIPHPDISVIPFRTADLDSMGLRKLREAESLTSMRTAMQALQDNEADALVSSGATHTLVEESSRSLTKLDGVASPALAAVYPTHLRSYNNDRFAMLLDVGAGVHASAEELHAYGVMGHVYASAISHIPNPSVGLLNLGESAVSGDATLRHAHALLHDHANLNFIGNVEGNDLPHGVADVVICEGIVGNTSLKLASGLTEVWTTLGEWAFKKRLSWRLGFALLARGLREIKSLSDYSEYGGAPLLGYKSVVIKTNSQSTSAALANGCRVAAKAVRENVSERIEKELTPRPPVAQHVAANR